MAGPVIIDPNMRVQSAIDGHGVVLANPLVQVELQQGRLCEPFPIRLGGYGYHLVFNRNAAHGQAFNLFRRWLHDKATCFSQPWIENL